MRAGCVHASRPGTEVIERGALDGAIGLHLWAAKMTTNSQAVRLVLEPMT